MTSEGLGEMSQGDSAETCTGKYPLTSLGGRAEGLACADREAVIGAYCWVTGEFSWLTGDYCWLPCDPCRLIGDPCWLTGDHCTVGCRFRI